MSLRSLVCIALASLAVAQSDPALGISAIEAHFKQADLTPQLFQTFSPGAVLDVKFGDTALQTPGQPLTVAQVQPQPTLKLTPANSSVQLNGEYTVAMVDADIVGSPQNSITRHWLINGAKINNNQVDNSSATAITAYGAPLPAEGSGPHRYVLAVYTQPSGFKAPDSPAPNSPIEKFDFQAYVKSANLNLLAANYMEVSQGQASMSISATSAVVSSTLAAAASGSASGAKPSGSGSSKPNGSTQLGFGVASGILALGLFIMAHVA